MNVQKMGKIQIQWVFVLFVEEEYVRITSKEKTPRYGMGNTASN